MNIVLGGTFKKWNAKLLGELLTLFRGNDLLVQHIALVTHQELVDVNVRMLLDLRDPVANALKGAAVRHVVDEQNALSAAKVRGSNCAEALLAGRVPDLKLDLGSINVHVLDLKVNPNRCDKGRAEGVIGVTEQEARLTHARVADHQQLDLNVVWGTSRSHCERENCRSGEEEREDIQRGRQGDETSHSKGTERTTLTEVKENGRSLLP